MPVEPKAFSTFERQRELAFGTRPALRMPQRTTPDADDAPSTIRLNDATPPVPIPPGHIGPVMLPGTGRLVYWTGRVAIGLRHQRAVHDEPVPQSTLWVQDLMLGAGARL